MSKFNHQIIKEIMKGFIIMFILENIKELYSFNSLLVCLTIFVNDY